jgi:DNA-binding MarR family transcriptional regulator
MKQQKKRDFICINTKKSSNWLKHGLEPQEALALWALIYESNVGGMVYASQTTLSLAVQCSRPTLSKGINGLVEKNLVTVIGRAKYQISPAIGNKLA